MLKNHAICVKSAYKLPQMTTCFESNGTVIQVRLQRMMNGITHQEA